LPLNAFAIMTKRYFWKWAILFVSGEKVVYVNYKGLIVNYRVGKHCGDLSAHTEYVIFVIEYVNFECPERLIIVKLLIKSC
jgi:hypothetical protein